MTTTMTPPPVPPASTEPQPLPPRGPSSAGRVVAILAIALGVLIVLGTVFSAVMSTVASALVRTETRSIADARFGDLDVELSAGDLTVVFVDGQRDAELEVTSSAGADAWTLAVDGDTLRVASPNQSFFGPRWWFNDTGRAVLRLPAAAQSSLDATFDVSAGELTVTGDFADLGLELGAGRASVTGTADRLGVDISAGGAELALGDVRTAELTVSAGSLSSRFTGAPPQSITADVSAGALSLRVPEGAYDVRSDVTAGRFENRLSSTPGASNTIDVRVSAGQVTLR